MLKGGCFCGALRYEISTHDFPVANCHCSMCRRTSAAAYVTWMIVPKNSYRLSKGAAAVLQSSSSGTRHFCNLCGTPISCLNTNHPDIVDVTLCSLDDPTALSPSFEFYAKKRLPWVNNLAALKVHK